MKRARAGTWGVSDPALAGVVANGLGVTEKATAHVHGRERA